MSQLITSRRRWLKVTLSLLAVVLLAYLAIMWVFHHWRGRQLTYIANYSQSLELPRGTLEYQDQGEGIPVLFLHGGGGGYDEGIPLRGMRLITPSRPGYLRTSRSIGETYQTEAQAYVQLLDSLGVERTAVVAFSAGGPPALEIAMAYPERVASLTLISAVSTPREASAPQPSPLRSWMDRWLGQDFLDWYYSVGLDLFPEKLMLEGTASLLSPTDQQYLREHPDNFEFMIQDYQRKAGAHSLRFPGLVNDRRRYATLSAADTLPIHSPTLLLHGTHDFSVSYEQSLTLSQRIPGAMLKPIERGGHMAYLARMDETLPMIRAFIMQHWSAGP